MGCDIHLTLERLKKKADVETVRVWVALLICKKRLVIGAASTENCVLNPEAFDAIIRFLPVSLTSEGSTWLPCEYA